MIIWLLGFIGFWVIALFVVDFLLSAPAYKGPESDHFDGKKFGLPSHPKSRTLVDIVKWSMSGEKGEWRKITPNGSQNSVPDSVNNDEIAVTFVNHSTFVIQLNGLNILTDPIWSNRASPYSWIGPRRMRPPGIRFGDLPEIDLVLLSHNHYDHLDLPTVLRLNEWFNPLFITPLGVQQYLNKKGISETVDLDWGDECEFKDQLKVTATPAKHFSGRGVFDRDKTLWCGFMLQTETDTIYYAGDTAYSDFFSEISSRFPSIDLSFIPIGAYKPSWFMSDIHCSPAEALQIHQDIGSPQSIGMHFGTFPLADEGMDEPQLDLAKAQKSHGISEDAFITLKEGDSRVFKKPVKQKVAINGK